MNRIRQARERAGLLQRAVAEKLKVGQNTVSNWERGKSQPDQQSLTMLADLLDVTTDYLLGRDPSSAKNTELHLLDLFGQLNAEGQEKLLEYADDLVASGKYIKTDQPSMAAEA